MVAILEIKLLRFHPTKNPDFPLHKCLGHNIFDIAPNLFIFGINSYLIGILVFI